MKRTGKAAARDLGQKVRDARRAKGMSQEALGEAVGLDKSWVSRIESGAAGLGEALVQARRIADALGVPLDALVPSTPPPKGRRPTPTRAAARTIRGDDHPRD
jgi:transcriptional regulator with XRE-family HTH domain